MNRAVQGLYAPGSTFKLVTAAAAPGGGLPHPGEPRFWTPGGYTYYDSPQPQCWLYRQEGRTHGLETVSEAIADSCNVFFYDAGRRVGIDTLGRYAPACWAWGEKTGVELAGEQAGVVAGPEYTASVGGTWYEGSVLSAAIGQENNRFTPLQLAHMTATPGGGRGTGGRSTSSARWRGRRPGRGSAWGQVDLSEGNVAAIREGMLAVTQTGSLAAAFQDLPFPGGGQDGLGPGGRGRRRPTPCWCASPPTTTPRSPWPWWRSRGAPGRRWGRWRPKPSLPGAGKAGL